MKTQLSLITILVIALFTISASPIKNVKISENIASKANPDYSFFRTHKQGRNGVTSTWGMTSENGAMYFSLMRTYEDPNDPYGWEEVSTIPCSSSRSYKWTDENVSPGYISYCVVTHMSDGTDVFSWINTIHIVSH